MSDGETVLVVEDDAALRASCRQGLAEAGYGVLDAASPREAEPLLLREAVDLIVTDLRMPHGGGQAVLDLAHRIAPGLPVILITAYPSVESAVSAFKSGVVDYLLKPFTCAQLMQAVEGALRQGRAEARAEVLRHVPPADTRLPELLGDAPAFREFLADLRRIAPLEGHALVVGPTGSGKELAARALHRFSPRRAGGPFVAVNCAALPEPLLEAELFGHTQGAFTGAVRAKAGLLEEADGGTLLLDEICDLPLAAQAKLLRALEERTARRVGGLDARALDVRIVAAAQKDLRGEVRAGKFRDDLYYRLSALEVRVPALSERLEDIPRLAVAFLDRLRAQHAGGPAVAGIEDEAIALLLSHAWPGNVRELQNVISRAYARASGPLLTAGEIARAGGFAGVRRAGGGAAGAASGQCPIREAALTHFERGYLMEALERHQGNVTHTANALGIHRTTLQRLLRKYRGEETMPSR
ncbi:MAG: sigma-54-dependent Fis family transcriptional regulator [Planctomycetes bacterium]|nr:sigma-54-dependent Fis family transcriptional regulator [Planctomycetota bacterium]